MQGAKQEEMETDKEGMETDQEGDGDGDGDGEERDGIRGERGAER